jgi:hypothetical protein
VPGTELGPPDLTCKKGNGKYVFSGLNSPELLEIAYLRTFSEDNPILRKRFINCDLVYKW